MKINPFQSTNVNPYKKQVNKQQQVSELKKAGNDKIEISDAAKSLQRQSQVTVDRQEQVREIKQQVESGQYKVNAEEAAKKMIDFWSKA